MDGQEKQGAAHWSLRDGHPAGQVCNLCNLRRHLFPAVTAVLLAVAWLPVPARAQLLSYAWGLSDSSSTGEQSTGYQVEYRQILYKNLTTTFDYVNEGHFTGHHPDGYGLQLWYRLLHTDWDHLSFSVGAGSFYYFDTVTPPGGASADVHGFAPMLSLAVRGQVYKKLYWVLAARSIDPSHDVKDQQLNAGLGYWFTGEATESGAEPRGIIELVREDSGNPDPDEVSLYGVLSVINNAGNPSSWGASAEYRYRFNHYLEGTLAYIYEGDPLVARRNGVTAQIWPVRTDIISGIEVGAGFGVYGFVDKKHELPGEGTAVAAAPVVSIMASRMFLQNCFGRFIWDRVVSNYNRDADIWRLGFGRTL